MSREKNAILDPRVAEALGSLQALILDHYPTAILTTFRGEDPEGIYLRAAVDLEDPDEVMDLAIDQLMVYQLEQELPVHLLPVRTDECIAAELTERETRRPGLASLPHLGSS